MRNLLICLNVLMLIVGMACPNVCARELTSQEIMSLLEEGMGQIAQDIGPAVVSISTEKIDSLKKQYRISADERFEMFYRNFLYGNIPRRAYKNLGLGSGVIIDTTGYILSCAHVVRDADSITVTLPDARFFSGKVVSVDHYSDLALLKIEGKNLPVAELGNSDTLMPGQWALALGNPFGFAIPDTKPLITNSIISGLHQFLPQTEDRTQAYHDLIQINASISPGLSGGPLVDKNGNIVGINAAMAHNKAGADSVGFAIPINYAKKMIEKMVEGEEILYRKLGIKVHDLTPALANYFGLQKPHGVLVEEILPDSPAVSAGIEEKDVIIRFGNQRISNTNSFINIVKELKKDSNNKIKVIRRTIAREFKITARDIAISELPTNIQPKYAVQPAKNVKEIKNDFLWRGMLITDLPDSLKDTSGVYVAKVNTGSSAEAGGITTGNIITFIDTMEIQNLNDLREAVKKISGNALVKTSQGYLVVPE